MVTAGDESFVSGRQENMNTHRISCCPFLYPISLLGTATVRVHSLRCHRNPAAKPLEMLKMIKCIENKTN